jgi:hypothetical protein
MTKGLQKLTELRHHSSELKDKINSTILAIKEKEFDEEGNLIRRLSPDEQFAIARKDYEIQRYKGEKPIIFDETVTAETISIYWRDGRKRNYKPANAQTQPAAAPVAASSSPAPDATPQGEASPVVQPSEAPAAPSAAPAAAPKSAAPETTSNGIDYKKLHRSRSVLRAVSRLQSLIEVLNSPDDAANIAKLTEITQSDANKDEKGIGKGLAYILLKLINDPEMDVILAKLAATFGIEDTDKLEEKVIQIDLEFSAKGIYPSES